jgi:hypothetical protein
MQKCNPEFDVGALMNETTRINIKILTLSP